MPILSARGGASAGAYGWGGATTSLLPGSFDSITSANGSGSSTITFNSIPQTYAHLQIRYIANDMAGYNIQLRLNNDSGLVYTGHGIYGQGSSVNTFSNNTGVHSYWYSQAFGGYQTNQMAAQIINIYNYTSSYNKTIDGIFGYEANTAGGGIICMASGLYVTTSAITRIDLIDGGGGFGSNSRFALYGIKGS